MILDLAVLAALAVSAIIAFLRGFIREVLTILGVVGGLAAAYFGGPAAAPTVLGWISPPVAEGEEKAKLFDLIPYDMAADALSFGGIFIIVVIVLSIASHLLAGWARAIGLGAVDRSFGVMFGLLRGVVIIGLLYLPVYVMVDQKVRDGWFEGSKTHFYVAATSDWMINLMPESLKEDMARKVEEGAETLGDTTREKLQELDVLGGGTAPAAKPGAERAGPMPPQEDPSAPPAPQGDAGQGYGGDQRGTMEELIRDNLKGNLNE